MKTTFCANRRRRSAARPISAVAVFGILTACAATTAPTSSAVTHPAPGSLTQMPTLQDSIEGSCLGGAIKECRVWGGNKFRKRYEYCGCRERGSN